VSGRGHLRQIFIRAAVSTILFFTYHFTIGAGNLWLLQTTPVPQDTIPEDTVQSRKYTPSFRPTYDFQDRYGDPFFHRKSSSPLFIEPSGVKLDYDLDTAGTYTIYERIGEVDFKPPAEITFEEYKRYNADRIKRDYFKSKSQGLDGESAVSGRRLIPKIYISPAFDRIFGGSYVEINPRGRVMLDFGARWQRIQNPSIPIRQQRNGGFEFDQQISMNVVGKIGEKLQITANFDNNNSFDFENNLKVEYTGFEEDIIKKLEIGNVSLPINNSLITGAQNLFGFKTQLQFGKLFVTGVD
jgi:cell surface protein SprA